MDIVGEYSVKQQLGSGAFAKIYLSEKNGRKVALKIACKSDSDAFRALATEKKCLELIAFGNNTNTNSGTTKDDSMDDQVEPESKTETNAALKKSKSTDRAQSCNPSSRGHKNIISYLDFYEDDKVGCLVLEYIPNGELFDFVMDRGKTQSKDQLGLPINYSKSIIKDLLEALNYIHKINISHGDVKLENIMLVQDFKESPTISTIKLIDFGLAEFPGPDGLISSKPRGSPLYLAPEAVLSLTRNAYLVDIWAAGIVLFCLLTFRMPFDFEASYAVIEGQNEQVRSNRMLARKIASGRYTWTSNEEENVEPQAKAFLTKLLARDPKDRSLAESLLNDEWLHIQGI